MKPLHKTLRSTLEKTVKKARDVAEEGAHAALQQLGVGDKQKPGFLTDEQAALRRRLRARGRQLGDALHADGAQDLTRLTREVAYEHWHRMLFARYLAANGLLVHPELNMPVTLGDCNELAEEEGARDGFVLAARYATQMLPQIFRKNDPVLDVSMAPEHRNKLQRLVEGLPGPVFEADDSLGWVYQFWQAKRKDEVNDSGVKIGADELPAVTQLFTEHYMVQFLLDNTLGAWWTARHPNVKHGTSPDADIGLDFEYLRFVDDEETGEQVSAAGTFEGWPDTAAELTLMDPCMGSGHFLVAALPMLTQMRMHEEGLAAQDAVDAVLRDNLHGLEIDERCTQIAAFALALAAWTFPGAEGYRALPEMNLACSGLAPEGKLSEWEQLAGDDERLQNGMRRLYTLFQDAPTLGSLIDPGAPENDLYTASFDELEPLLKQALAGEADAETTEREVVAYGIARAAEMLSGQYHLVITNVPYLNRGNQDTAMKTWLQEHYPFGKKDLATAFVERCLNLCSDGREEAGSISVVAPQNWLFLTSYKKLRKNLLNRQSWNLLGRLGPNAFETISGEVVNVSLYTITHAHPQESHTLRGVDALDGGDHVEKEHLLTGSKVVELPQHDQLDNPDSRILLVDLQNQDLLKEVADGVHGLGTKDKPRWIRQYWELTDSFREWKFMQTTSNRRDVEWGGRECSVRWGSDELHRLDGEGWAILAGSMAWRKKGVAVDQMGNLVSSIYSGDLFDKNIAAIVPENPGHLPAIWAFCSSPEYSKAVRKVDMSIKVTNASLVKVPFDLDHWQQVADEKYPDGLPDPYSDDPTQWIFHGHPRPSERPLQVAVARLLGYRWPVERDDEMELSDEARAWIARAQELNEFADEDGIVCLPALQGQRKAIDRLRDLLGAAYGSDWSVAKEDELLKDWGYKTGGLERWLEGKFMRQHNKLFGNRPFIWHITDGHNEGFGALVNYHKLDRATLERLTYTYLGAWVKRQEAALSRGEEGAEGRVLAAQQLQDELKKIIEGEPPHDVFVRWKEAHEQPIGWDPDLNDGVLLNIKPFVKGDSRPGVLKKDPNVRYTKDRGKNPEGAPWGPLRYNRYEDVPEEHKLKDARGKAIKRLTTDVKRRVRGEVEGESP